MTSQKTRIYGLIGYPTRHSLSPAMHNAAFQCLGIDAQYKLFEVEPAKLEAFLLDNIKVLDTQGEVFYSQDIIGFNITIPHKIKAREILEGNFPFNKNIPKMLEVQYYVKLSGAVNTVKRDGDKPPRYWNTDATGFLRSLKEKKEGWGLGFEPKNKKVILVGCGGAGRAIIASLSWINVGVKKIYINDIEVKAINSAKEYFWQLPQSPHLKGKLEFILTKDIPNVIKDCELLINASPVGMKGEDISVVDKSLLAKNKQLSVYDIVYNRNNETRLIRDAKSQGLPVIDGRSMLLYQGAAAFNLWTGREAPVEIMREALNEGVKKI